jgi:hypothetical protein
VTPTTRTPRLLARPGLWIAAGGFAVVGAVLAVLADPAWAALAVLGGLALILVPDPASPTDQE